jgi:hypothetical protein
MYLFLCILLISYVSGGTPYTITTADQAKIVDYHNQVRRNYKVPDLKWSEDLARTARERAALCNCQHTTDKTVGENLAAGGYPTMFEDPAIREYFGIGGYPYLGFDYLVTQWKDEETAYNCQTNTCSGVCGHFTQLTWKETTEVGCALTDCPGSGCGFPDEYKVEYFVCQYRVPGNMGGKTCGITCPAANPTPAINALTAEETEETQIATQNGRHADSISVPTGAFVGVAVVCGLIVFLAIMVVVAFIVVIKKNGDGKSVPLL